MERVVQDHADHAVLVRDGGGLVGLELGFHEVGDVGLLFVVGHLHRLLGTGGEDAGEDGEEEDRYQDAGALFHDRKDRDTCSR